MVSVANVYAWGLYVGAVLWDDIRRDDLLAVASSVGISGADILIDQVADAVAQWLSIASSCGLPESSSKAIWSVIKP